MRDTGIQELNIHCKQISVTVIKLELLEQSESTRCMLDEGRKLLIDKCQYAVAVGYNLGGRERDG